MPRKTAAATAKEKPTSMADARVETKRKANRDKLFLSELQKTKKVFAAAASDFSTSLSSMLEDKFSA